MKTSWPRQLLSIVLLFSFACATLGADSPERPAAVLHANGKVQVNGSDIRKVTTLFSGDSVQTSDDSVANIVAGGSSILVLPNASVKFLGNVLVCIESPENIFADITPIHLHFPAGAQDSSECLSSIGT